MSLNFNKSAWYQVEVAASKTLSMAGTVLYAGNGTSGAAFMQVTNTSLPQQLWQFWQYNSTYYLLRTKDGGPNGYLGTAVSGTDVDVAGNTVPIMAHYNVSDNSMFWRINSLQDGNWYFINAANGTNFRLAVRNNGLMAMSSNISGTHDEQAFSWNSVSALSNDRYSTVNTFPTSSRAAAVAPTNTATITGTPTSTATSSSSPSSGGLSTGAQAGIGVGVAIVALALIGALIFFFLRRRKAKKAYQPAATEGPYSGYSDAAQGHREPQEMDGVPMAEMENKPVAQVKKEPMPPVEMQGDTDFYAPNANKTPTR